MRFAPGPSIPTRKYAGRACRTDVVYADLDPTDFPVAERKAPRHVDARKPDTHVDQLVKESGNDAWKILDDPPPRQQKMGWPQEKHFKEDNNVQKNPKHKDVHDGRWEQRAEFAEKGARKVQLPAAGDLHEGRFEGRTAPAEEDREKGKMLATHMHSRRWQQRAAVAYGPKKKKLVAEAQAKHGLHEGRWEARAEWARGHREGHGPPARAPIDSFADVRAAGAHQREEARRLNSDPPEADPGGPREDRQTHAGRWQERAFSAADNRRHKSKWAEPRGEPQRQHEARGQVQKGDPTVGFVPPADLHDGRWQARAEAAKPERRPERAPPGEHLPWEIENMDHAMEAGHRIQHYGDGPWEGCHARKMSTITRPKPRPGAPGAGHARPMSGVAGFQLGPGGEEGGVCEPLRPTAGHGRKDPARALYGHENPMRAAREPRAEGAAGGQKALEMTYAKGVTKAKMQLGVAAGKREYRRRGTDVTQNPPTDLNPKKEGWLETRRVVKAGAQAGGGAREDVAAVTPLGLCMVAADEGGNPAPRPYHGRRTSDINFASHAEKAQQRGRNPGERAPDPRVYEGEEAEERAERAAQEAWNADPPPAYNLKASDVTRAPPQHACSMWEVMASPYGMRRDSSDPRAAVVFDTFCAEGQIRRVYRGGVTGEEEKEPVAAGRPSSAREPASAREPPASSSGGGSSRGGSCASCGSSFERCGICGCSGHTGIRGDSLRLRKPIPDGNATQLMKAQLKLAVLNANRNMKAQVRGEQPHHPCKPTVEGISGCLMHQPMVVGMRAAGIPVGGNKVSGRAIAVRA